MTAGPDTTLNFTFLNAVFGRMSVPIVFTFFASW